MPADGTDDLYERFIAAHDRYLDLPRREQGPALFPVYQDLFGAVIGHLDAASSRQLRQLSLAAGTMGSLTGERHYLQHQMAAVDLLVDRGDSHDGDIAWLYRSLVNTRDFARAESLRVQHPGVPLPPVPDIVSLAEPAPGTKLVYRIDDEAQRLYEHAVSVDRGTWLVALVSPNCPYSRQALEELSRGEQFLSLVGDDVLWLSTPTGILHLSDYQQWHREHPSIRMTIAVDAHDWPFVDAWAFPSFLVLRDAS